MGDKKPKNAFLSMRIQDLWLQHIRRDAQIPSYCVLGISVKEAGKPCPFLLGNKITALDGTCTADSLKRH